MIKLNFITSQRKIIRFEIEDRKIIYHDDIWKQGIQVMPKDENLVNKLIQSGKPNLRMMAALIIDSNKGNSLKEYNACKNEDDLAELIKKDCKSKGLSEVKY